MVASLLENETVDAEEVIAILEGKPYDRAVLDTAASTETESERSPVEEPKRAPEKPSRLPPKISPEPA